MAKSGLGALTLPGGRPPQGPELSSPCLKPGHPQPLRSPEVPWLLKASRRSGCCDALTVRCAPTLGEVLLLTAPPSAWGTPGSYGGRLSPSPTAARLAARPRLRPDPQAQRGQETYPRSHSKQATHRARPQHSPCEVPSAHRASRSRSRDCGAMRGREQGRARGTQTEAPARRAPHKTPFLPTRPAFPAVPGP